MDDFSLKCSLKLGEIVGATLWLDGKGFFANWHCQRLELEHVPSGRAWRFAVQKSVPAGKTSAAGLRLKPEVRTARVLHCYAGLGR